MSIVERLNRNRQEREQNQRQQAQQAQQVGREINVRSAPLVLASKRESYYQERLNKLVDGYQCLQIDTREAGIKAERELLTLAHDVILKNLVNDNEVSPTFKRQVMSRIMNLAESCGYKGTYSPEEVENDDQEEVKTRGFTGHRIPVRQLPDGIDDPQSATPFGTQSDLNERAKEASFVRPRLDTRYLMYNVDYSGMELEREKIRSMLIDPLTYKSLYSGDSPNTLMLYGPPGTGKTLLADATVSMYVDYLSKHRHQGRIDDVDYVRLYKVTGASLRSRWRGQSESRIELTYMFLENVGREMEKLTGQPARMILFIDEAEGLLSDRDAGGATDSNVSDIVNMFLPILDDRKRFSHVVTIIATNYPWQLDDAIERRFVNSIFTNLPSRKTSGDLLERLVFGYIEGNSVGGKSWASNTANFKYDNAVKNMKKVLADIADLCMPENQTLNMMKDATNEKARAVIQSQVPTSGNGRFPGGLSLSDIAYLAVVLRNALINDFLELPHKDKTCTIRPNQRRCEEACRGVRSSLVDENKHDSLDADLSKLRQAPFVSKDVLDAIVSKYDISMPPSMKADLLKYKPAVIEALEDKKLLETKEDTDSDDDANSEFVKEARYTLKDEKITCVSLCTPCPNTIAELETRRLTWEFISSRPKQHIRSILEKAFEHNARSSVDVEKYLMTLQFAYPQTDDYRATLRRNAVNTAVVAQVLKGLGGTRFGLS
jgi:SpoVK/Ycf46/Vps4 family AAA+-type ATPase